MLEARQAGENEEKLGVFFATRREMEGEKEPACWRLAQGKSDLTSWACTFGVLGLPLLYWLFALPLLSLSAQSFSSAPCTGHGAA